MAVKILRDNDGYSCLYCSVTMWAFGNIFYKNEEPEDFIDWLNENVKDRDSDPRSFNEKELSEKINEWRNINLKKEM